MHFSFQKAPTAPRKMIRRMSKHARKSAIGLKESHFNRVRSTPVHRGVRTRIYGRIERSYRSDARRRARRRVAMGLEPDCCVAPPAPGRRRPGRPGPARRARVPEPAIQVAGARRWDGRGGSTHDDGTRSEPRLLTGRGQEFNVGCRGSGSGPGPAVVATGRRRAACPLLPCPGLIMPSAL